MLRGVRRQVKCSLAERWCSNAERKEKGNVYMSGEMTDKWRVLRLKCSEFRKTLKKEKKVCKKVLTFLAKGDIMNKLIRTAHTKRTALNLENDTEQE